MIISAAGQLPVAATTTLVFLAVRSLLSPAPRKVAARWLRRTGRISFHIESQACSHLEQRQLRNSLSLSSLLSSPLLSHLSLISSPLSSLSPLLSSLISLYLSSPYLSLSLSSLSSRSLSPPLLLLLLLLLRLLLELAVRGSCRGNTTRKRCSSINNRT